MPTPAQIVRTFFDVVRSGRDPDRASEFMAARVLAHQVQSEEALTVERTPEEYAAHVREFLDAYGAFVLTIEELLAQDDRVYVRWRQEGRHVGPVGPYAPTGHTIVQRSSAVYRVEQGRITEYWIQLDRAGLEAQLVRDGRAAAPEA